ncbi:MAG: polymorphic toxin-type HINT domain-containing protein [Promethearchaeota archaeon]
MKRLFLLLGLLVSQSIFSQGFLAGTLVKVPDGYKPIEQIEEGEFVLCYDHRNNCLEPGRVIQALIRQTESLVKITFDGESIFTVHDQEFNSDKFWIKASNLSIERTLWSLNNHQLPIDNIEIIEESAYVYDLSILKFGRYLVSLHDIEVHNCITEAFYKNPEKTIELVQLAYRGLGIFITAKIPQYLDNVSSKMSQMRHKYRTCQEAPAIPVREGKVKIQEGTYGYVESPAGPMTPGEFKEYYESAHHNTNFAGSKYIPIITIKGSLVDTPEGIFPYRYGFIHVPNRNTFTLEDYTKDYLRRSKARNRGPRYPFSKSTSCGGGGKPPDDPWHNYSGSRKSPKNLIGSGNFSKHHPHGIYKDAPYHNKRGSYHGKSPCPQNGQAALDKSVNYSSTSPHRIGISNGQFVVLNQTRPGEFHGHVRKWGELTEPMRRKLKSTGWVNSRGRIIK